MDHKFSSFARYRSVRLTDDERALLRSTIAASMDAVTYAEPSIFAKGMQHGLRIALSTFALVVFVGGAISKVAANALPGDPLYPFKIHVNETVKGFFFTTPAEKVAWQQNRVEARIKEIQTLATKNTLTKTKQASAEKALNGSVTALSASLAKLSNDDPGAALSATTSLERNLQVGKATLQSTLAEKDGTADASASAAAIANVDGTIAKVSAQEVTILSKEVDHIVEDASKTPSATDPSLDTNLSTASQNQSTSLSTAPDKEKRAKVTPLAP